MSFFVADNKIPIVQKSIGIPAINGLSYNPGQQIDFYIDPQQVKFFNPKNSYLSWDVKIQMPSDTDGQLTKLVLDSHIGSQVVIKDVRIYDGSNNTLLEEIVGYNIATMLKYDYECNDSLRNKRALSEGAGRIGDPEGSQGCDTSYQNTSINQYQTKNSDTTQSASLLNASYLDVKCCLPLNTGIFSNDKIFPCMLTQGLRISIVLEDSVKCIRSLEGTMVNRKTNLNPFVHSQNGCLTNANGSFSAGVNASKIYIANFNGYTNPEFLPFCVGESIGFFQFNGTNASYLGVRAGAVGTKPVIRSIGLDTVGGQDFVVLTTNNFSLTASLVTNSNASTVIYSTTTDVATNFNPTYQLNNVEMYLEVVDMGSNYEADMMRKMREGGTINYDFLSMTNYRYSQLASDIVANIQLPIENRRMRSIICVPTDSTNYTATQVLTASGTYVIEDRPVNKEREGNVFLNQDRCGLAGISDEISSYQFLYNGKLQPSRLVNCSKTSSKKSVSQQHLIELEKALSSAGITGQSLLQFNKNFLIGRSLTAGQNGVYDGRGRQFSLQVNYQKTTAPTKNKLWNNYVYHIRRMIVKGDSISVEV